MDLAFSLATYAERVRRTEARLQADGLDALVVNLPDNINYLCGFDSLGYLWFQALILAPGLREPIFVTRSCEEPCTWELSAVREARFYDVARQDPVAIVADELGKLGLAEGRIGLELQAFTFLPVQHERLRTLMPRATFVDASLAVAEERLVKSPEEIAYQRSAAQMADRAMQVVLANLRPGISEVALAGIAAHALGEAGSEHAAIPPMVASGPRSTMIHAMPSARSIGLGDVVIIELAGVVRRYHAVLMRTAVVGRPSPEVQAAHNLLEEATAAAVRACEAGAPAGAADRACQDILARGDLARRRAHRIGYSLGIAYPPTWLEAMMLDEADTHRLAPGMSFTVEPNLSLYDRGFGLKLGETVLCSDPGALSLSSLPRELTVVSA